jgi:hypothetical protein
MRSEKILGPIYQRADPMAEPPTADSNRALRAWPSTGATVMRVAIPVFHIPTLVGTLIRDLE